jgi:hypothetical protein
VTRDPLASYLDWVADRDNLTVSVLLMLLTTGLAVAAFIGVICLVVWVAS